MLGHCPHMAPLGDPLCRACWVPVPLIAVFPFFPVSEGSPAGTCPSIPAGRGWLAWAREYTRACPLGGTPEPTLLLCFAFLMLLKQQDHLREVGGTHSWFLSSRRNPSYSAPGQALVESAPCPTPTAPAPCHPANSPFPLYDPAGPSCLLRGNEAVTWPGCSPCWLPGHCAHCSPCPMTPSRGCCSEPRH